MLCGTGRRIINPEVGHELAGYGPYKNIGVHDDLTVTALYLSDGSTQAVLLAYDLIAVPEPINGRVRKAVGEATGLSPDQVFITASHVHSGPEVRETYFGVIPVMNFRPDYNQRLVEWSAQAAADAKGNAEECWLSYNFAMCDENINRRFAFPNRKWASTPHSKDLTGLSKDFVDQELGIVGFRKVSERNQYKAVLTNYTAHPLCVGCSSGLVTADFQGELRRTVEETFSGCMCLATTGAAGDNHPRLSEAGFEAARQMGANLGKVAIMRLFDAGRAFDSKLRLARGQVNLKVKDHKTASVMPELSDRWFKPVEPTDEPLEAAAPYALLGIGPILLAGLPGEPSACLGAMIKWSSPFLKSFVLFESTDDTGYMAARNQFLWGNYEPFESVLAMGESERLVAKVLDDAVKLVDAQPLQLNPPPAAQTPQKK